MSTQDRSTLPNLPCVILAGGQSRRFGSNKAFASFQGERLIDRLNERIRHQTTGTIAINAYPGLGFGEICQPLVTDYLTDSLGTLAGLHGAMNWERKAGYAAVITTPVDTPILTIDFVERIFATEAPAIAKSNDRLHFAHGFWPMTLTAELGSAVERGRRSARDWAVECKAAEYEFHEQAGLHPVYNVNTPDDLRKLETLSMICVRWIHTHGGFFFLEYFRLLNKRFQRDAFG